MKKRVLFVILAVILITLVFTPKLLSHCEIPCGIYDDEMRIKMIKEHITTVEKAMNEIKRLKGEEDKNYNQLVRWINNKEYHAESLQEIVYQYFMTQRVQPVMEENTEEYKEYVTKITLLHKMLFYAMKTKQTTDLENISKLRSIVEDFSKVYFEEHGHTH